MERSNEDANSVIIQQPGMPNNKINSSQSKDIKDNSLLSNDNVDIDIDPKVRGNYVVVNLCSCYWSCGKNNDK